VVPFLGEDRNYLFHSVQNNSGNHPASYPMGTGTLSLGIKQPVREADHSPPYTSEVKNGGLYLHSPIPLHGVVPN
jgi:hypothetical protein